MGAAPFGKRLVIGAPPPEETPAGRNSPRDTVTQTEFVYDSTSFVRNQDSPRSGLGVRRSSHNSTREDASQLGMFPDSQTPSWDNFQ